MNLSVVQRWVLFALVLTAGILNYVDRQIISILKPQIAGELGWDDARYGALGLWFQWSSALAFVVTGWLADKLGVKWANPIGVAAWSLAAMLHGWATGFGQFVVCRVALGATEAMGTPNQVKTVATLFPPRLRSTGFGFTNAVGSAGAVVTPLVIPAVAALYGWRAAFIGTGVIGLAWAVLWLAATRGVDFSARGEPEPNVAAEPDHPVPDFGPIATDRRTWAITVAKVLSDATWWLMLFWMPDYFHREFGLSGTALAAPLAIAYAGSALGAIGFGAASSALLAREVSVNRVRKGLMLISALCVVPVSLALRLHDYGASIGILALALAGHQGFSTNLFALITDVTPHERVGRVTAFAAFFGNVGGGVIQFLAGITLNAGLGYGPLFAFASVSYLLALGWIQLLLPYITPLRKVHDSVVVIPH